jgi:hypothetical protein
MGIFRMGALPAGEQLGKHGQPDTIVEVAEEQGRAADERAHQAWMANFQRDDNPTRTATRLESNSNRAA